MKSCDAEPQRSLNSPELNQAAAANVVLVSMPWTTVLQPSLGLAVLRAELRRQAIACRVFHANLWLLKYLSAETYFGVARLDGLNEFLCTALLDPEIDAIQLEALAQHCRIICASGRSLAHYREPEELFELLLAIRNHVIPRFLGECAEKILAMQPTMVGFSCLFDQTLAAAALAKLLKEIRPDLPTALGGYAVQHENGTEVLKAFPQIDCIARGDGEPVIAKLAQASIGQISIEFDPRRHHPTQHRPSADNGLDQFARGYRP